MKSIEQQRKIIDAATPGPWTVDIETERDEVVGEYPIQCTVFGLGRSFWSEEWADPDDWKRSCDNAEFVATARTEYPALLDWAERAREMLKLFLDDRLLKSIIEQLLTELPEKDSK